MYYSVDMKQARNRVAVGLSILAAATFALTACSGSGSSSVAGTSWGDPDVSDKPSINFETDGGVNGTDGCNRVMGSWSEEDGTVDLGALASTMMFCEGVDTWLTTATTAKLDGGSLVFFNPGGEEVGTLSPASSAE